MEIFGSLHFGYPVIPHRQEVACNLIQICVSFYPLCAMYLTNAELDQFNFWFVCSIPEFWTHLKINSFGLYLPILSTSTHIYPLLSARSIYLQQFSDLQPRLSSSRMQVPRYPYLCFPSTHVPFIPFNQPIHTSVVCYNSLSGRACEIKINICVFASFHCYHFVLLLSAFRRSPAIKPFHGLTTSVSLENFV